MGQGWERTREGYHMRRAPRDNRRPDAGPPPDLSCNEPLILRRLLAESLRRLRAGRKVEEDHGVVHPEVGSIVRDVERLSRRLNALTHHQEAEQEDTSSLFENL